MNNNSYYPFERNNYFYGKLLTVRDFENLQQYFNDKRRFINRLVHGAGIVCGLGVVSAEEDSVSVQSGFALDYQGREIVIDKAITRKLAMLDGYENIKDSTHAYLCVEYSESMKEPINALADGQSGENNYNRVSEEYRLFLEAGQPNIEAIIEMGDLVSASTVYSAHGITIIQVTPRYVRTGQEFTVKYIVQKETGLPPISFKYSFTSEHITNAKGEHNIVFEFQENPAENKSEYQLEYILKNNFVTDMAVELSKNDGLIEVEIGDLNDSAEVRKTVVINVTDTNSEDKIRKYLLQKSLESSTSGGELPIVLARIDLLRAGASYIIKGIEQVPFAQYYNKDRQSSSIYGSKDNEAKFNSTTAVKLLKSWEKPEASVKYNSETNNFNFDFGFPQLESGDYLSSSGVATIELGMDARANSRFISEQIPHNLGLGAVCIYVSVQYRNEETENSCLVFGNAEVFKKKEIDERIPKVESAVLLYPEKGTFQIGVRLWDTMDDTILKMRWFAFRVRKDSEEMSIKNNVTIKVEPSVYNAKTREKVAFNANVNGTDNKQVVWSVVEAEGGSIDENGLYQAPSTPGTYEICATCADNTSIKSSAFVLVQ